MRNRVEITGVNTSELKTLSNERMMELIVKSQNGDDAARDELVLGNLKLILSVIKKFAHRGENLDDLFQVGCLGLLKAIDNFDMSHGVRFSTYAVPMIIGEIRRYLRDNSSIRVSRSLKDIAYKALHFKEQFLREQHREPTAEEIAEELGVEPIDVIVSLEAIQDPISIYTPLL
jgi:RNA polymerase sporulation-specific sigma factor